MERPLVFRSLVRVVVALLIFPAAVAAQRPATVQTARPATVLERPRGDSAIVVSVPAGAVLTVVEERVNWFLVDVPDGLETRRGWINRQTLEQAGRTVATSSSSAPPATGGQGASARGSKPRGFVVVNGAYQLTTNDFADGAVKFENAEDGRFDTTYVVKGGPAFDVAAGGTFGGVFGIGVGVTRFSVSTPASLTATIPHPFFFDQPRSVAGEVAELTREELAVHVQARGVFPIGERLQVMVFGGPSLFQVKQTMVTDYSIAESFPFDDATFQSATTERASVTKIGFNVGGDVSFFFTRQLGVGATVQFSGASVDLPGALGATTNVKVGGGQAGAGLRLRF